jgi:hypothetical protein
VRRWLLQHGYIEWQPVEVRGRAKQAIALSSLREEAAAAGKDAAPIPIPVIQYAAGSSPELNGSHPERKPLPAVRPMNALLDEPLSSNGPQKGGKRRQHAPEDGRSEPDLGLAEMVNTLSEVTGLDGHHFWHELSGNARELLEGGYTAVEILTYFGRSRVDPGRWNWYLKDWRGKNGEMPALKALWETIAGARSWQPTEGQRDWLSDIAVFEE